MFLIQDTLFKMTLWGIGLGLAVILALLPAVLLVGWGKWRPFRAAALVTVFIGLGFTSGWCVPEPRLSQECYYIIPLVSDLSILVPIIGDLLLGFLLLWAAAALFREEGALLRGTPPLPQRLLNILIGVFLGMLVPWALSLLASIWYLQRLADAALL